MLKRLFNRTVVALLQRLDDLLVQVYSLPDSKTRGLSLAVVFAARRLVLFLQSGMVFQLYLLEGQPEGSGVPLRTAYLCAGRGMEFLAQRIYGGRPFQCKHRGRVFFWQQARAAQQLSREVDLVIVERNTLLGWKPNDGDWMIAPTWVRMALEIDLQKGWEEVERGFKKHARNIRRLKKAGFRYRISRDRKDFDFFYDRMYVPLVTQRHQEEAFVDSHAHLLSYFQRGFLLLIMDDEGQPIAADLDYVQGDMLFGIACGVLDGDPALLEEGALSAIYYYALHWMYENRISRCDIGEVRPFVSNGVYQNKRRWGYQPEQELWNTREWLIWVPNAAPEAAARVKDLDFIPEFTRRGGNQITQPMERMPG